MAAFSHCRRPVISKVLSLPVQFRTISTQVSRPAHTLAHRQPHVLIVGGSYGGLSTLNSLIDLSNGKAQPKSPHNLPEIGRPLPLKPRYTVLDLKDGFYHTAGAPLGQISPTYARQFWVSYDEFRKDELDDEHIDFVQGQATTLDSEVKMLSYMDTKGITKRLAYDYMVVATGVQRAFPVVPRAHNRIQYLADVEKFSLQMKAANSIVIVGGGAVGTQMAGEIKSNFPRAKVTLVHAEGQLLNVEPLPDVFKAKTLESLRRGGVEVKLGHRVIGERPGEEGDKLLTLAGGEVISCDEVIWTATKRRPGTGFLSKSAVDEKGYIKVKPTLQFQRTIPNSLHHFAVGDVVAWSGIKRVNNTKSMSQYCATNLAELILAAEDGVEPAFMAECPEFQPRMSLAIGDDAVVYRGGGDDHVKSGKELKHRIFGKGLGIDETLIGLHLKSQPERTGLPRGHDFSGAVHPMMHREPPRAQMAA